MANTLNQILVWLWRRFSRQTRWHVLWMLSAKFMVGVSGGVLDSQNRILLLRHRFWREGTWGLPGGHVRRRETLEAALVREIKEETGYDVEVVSLVEIASGFKLRIEVVFVARLRNGTRRLDDWEVIT